MFEKLVKINNRPKPFEFYTAENLWNDSYRSKQMLQYHLNESIDVSSRNHRFITDSVEWISNHFGLNEDSMIADFGCGPGLYANRLAEKKLNVTGIDFSKNSIEYARAAAKKNSLKINFINRNYLEFSSSERFDLIMMIMCDYCALSSAQRKSLLGIFSSHLKEDGSILLDVYSQNAFNKREETSVYEKNQLNRFWAENDYYAFVNSFKYEEEMVCLDKFSIFEKAENYTVYNWLQYFTLDSIRSEFSEAGFSVTEVLGNVAGAEYAEAGDEFAVIAKKQL